MSVRGIFSAVLIRLSKRVIKVLGHENATGTSSLWHARPFSLLCLAIALSHYSSNAQIISNNHKEKTGEKTYKAPGNIYYVNDNSTTGDIFTTAIGNDAAGRGTTAATPKLTLSSLLSEYSAVLAAGDTIKIDAGTYNGEENINFAVAGITFTGAGPSLTIFDDNGAGAATNFFMYIHASNVTLKNMTIREYENNGTQTPGHSGQAITVQNATGVLFENIVSSYNGQSGGNPSISVLSNSGVTIRGGGGLCNVWQTMYTGGVEAYGTNINLSIENYVFAYNFKESGYDGGAILIDGNNTTNVTVKNCKIYNNIAVKGGAIAMRDGVLTVTDCTFENNVAGQISTTVYGGAVFINAGTAKFSRCLFLNNTTSSTVRGGGIAARYITLSGSGFSSNKVSDITVDSCVFQSNAGSTNGMDIYGYGGTYACTINMSDCQFLTGSNYNIVNGGSASISVTYFGTAPTTNGTVTKTLSAHTLFTPNPVIPTFTGDCTSGIVLPVELTGFYGICAGPKTELYWQTASETNNDFFLVERSENGVDFVPLGRVDGHGNSNTLIQYNFSDDLPAGPGCYYRLVQTDFDGRFAISDPIFVESGCNDQQYIMTSFFNSDDHSLNIEVISAYSESADLMLSDNFGNQLVRQKEFLNEGINKIVLPLDPAVHGVCILLLTSPKKQSVQKVFIR